jgi:hypothetical protein
MKIKTKLIIQIEGGCYMTNKDFGDYNIADLPKEDIQDICDLEKSLSSKTNKDVVLIAYQQKNKAEV